MERFVYTSTAQEVVFGTGSLADLGDIVQRYNWHRLMLCTIGRFQSSGLVDQIDGMLRDRLVAVYDQVQPHVQLHQVEEAVALALERDVDAVIGLGGGSPIGLAKAVSMAVEEERRGRSASATTDRPLVPVVAIPTTYAGSEMTPVYGVTQEVDGEVRKVTVNDARIAPKLALYDPQLTLSLPPRMTASTGINALAHCVEAVYSSTRNPLSSAAALQGVRHIVRALPIAVEEGDNRAARAEMLLGAHLAAVALAKVKMGLHHGLCHVLGGTAGVPHGIANSIVLPHAMRFNLDAMAAELADVARAMGLPDGGGEAELGEQGAQAAYDLIGRMGLPQRLRDVGVAAADLPNLAQVALKSQAVLNNPKPITDAAQTEAVLRAAW